MIDYLQKTKIFSIPFFILIGGLSILLIFFTKSEIALWVNAHNNSVLDIFFRIITNLGDGIAATVISLLFLIFNMKRGIILLGSFLLSGLLIQLLKIFIFPDVIRPVALLGQTHVLHLVDGVKILFNKSFPSGHTGTAFAIFFCLAAFTDKNRIQFLALLTAFLVAYSRMYLSQHFLPDVIAGAVIGTFTSLCLLVLFEHKKLLGTLNHPIFSIKKSHVN